MAARLPARAQLLTDDERAPERQGWAAGGIFLWTGSLNPLLSQDRARNNLRAGQLSSFPDTISFKTKKFKYKLI